jgi:hypothetical protein
MGHRIKYHVAGRFEGQFKTLQDLALKSGDPFPEGSKHLIRIFRGTISSHRSINQEEFKDSVGEINGSHINNIQIEAGNDWPEEHTRIFSLKEFKLINPDISVVHSLNGHTYGRIAGDITASVTEGSYEELKELKDEVKKPLQLWPIWNNNNPNPKDNDNRNPSRGDENSSTYSGENSNLEGPVKRGCANILAFGNGILKWLWGLLLIIALLYFLFKFTEWGKQIMCRIEKWCLEKELTELQNDITRMEDIIQKTRPLASQCGGSEEYKGTNQEQIYTYTLGQTSGNVMIPYQMFKIPDRMEVMFNGKLVAETEGENGFASGSDTLLFQYAFNPNELHELTIRIIPNQEYATTEWKFNVICPK